VIKIETSLDWQNLCAAVNAAREAAGWDATDVKVEISSNSGITSLVLLVAPPRRDNGGATQVEEDEVG
jgi:hypothetical protein